MWNTQDAVNLRDFLSKTPHFIPSLEAKLKRCRGTTMEERATSGSERQGGEDIIAFIKSELATDKPRSGAVTGGEFIQDNQ